VQIYERCKKSWVTPHFLRRRFTPMYLRSELRKPTNKHILGLKEIAPRLLKAT
jgi:hypothetical protein